MKLAIISHTEHYRNEAGEIVGWGPTIREINHLTDIFDEVLHIAPLHLGDAPPSATAYQSDKITFVPLIPTGGKSLWDKMGIIRHAPANIYTIKEAIHSADIIQFRAPTNMGLYVLPYLKLFNKKPYWVKYAGNWAQENPPKSYALQRWWLENNYGKCKVTINGKWPGQKKHLLSFENPCLDTVELEKAKESANQKDFSTKLNFCFVGRLEDAKGVHRILEAFKNIGLDDRIGDIHLVGSGPKENEYKEFAKDIKANVVFHGFLPRESIGDIYKNSHFFLLPSDSEGFPKVVAEAAAYGCIPIVSAVSSIPQYVNSDNGFLLHDISSAELKSILHEIFEVNSSAELKKLSINIISLAKKFTFEYYNQRVLSDICETHK